MNEALLQLTKRNDARLAEFRAKAVEFSPYLTSMKLEGPGGRRATVTRHGIEFDAHGVSTGRELREVATWLWHLADALEK